MSPYLRRLEKVRRAIEYCAPFAITFIGYCDDFPAASQLFGWQIRESVLFVGRRLSYYVATFDDYYVGMLVRDIDARDVPRVMPRYERDWTWPVKLIAMLEASGLKTVQTGNEPIFLKDRNGKGVIAIT